MKGGWRFNDNGTARRARGDGGTARRQRRLGRRATAMRWRAVMERRQAACEARVARHGARRGGGSGERRRRRARGDQTSMAMDGDGSSGLKASKGGTAVGRERARLGPH